LNGVKATLLKPPVLMWQADIVSARVKPLNKPPAGASLRAHETQFQNKLFVKGGHNF